MTGSEASVDAVAVLVADDPWTVRSATTANPRQATRTPRSGQLDGAPRIEARMNAPARKPAAMSWLLGGGVDLNLGEGEGSNEGLVGEVVRVWSLASWCSLRWPDSDPRQMNGSDRVQVSDPREAAY